MSLFFANMQLTSTNYTGTLRVVIAGVTGGAMVTPVTYSIPIVAGQTAAVGTLKFAPTQTGEVSYTINVTTAEGIGIASKTVTATAVATTLVPTIQIEYGGEYLIARYNDWGTMRSWGGYKEVNAKIWFTPELDHPAPLGATNILQVALTPKYLYRTPQAFQPDPYANPDHWQLQYISQGSGYTSFRTVTATYAKSETQESYVLMEEDGDVLKPHTFGKTYVSMPMYYDDAVAAGMEVTSMEYTMGVRPSSSEIVLTSKITNVPLTIETNIYRINYINNLN